MTPLATTVLSRIGEAINHTIVLPIVMFSPTSRCNSRCVSCGWWRSRGDGELSLAEIDNIAADLAELGTRLVVFTGGEPLLRPGVFEAARLFDERGIALHLLTSGIGLESRAAAVAELFSRVIVSLDGDSAETYAAIRGVDGFGALTSGVGRLKAIAPALPISARSTIHRLNFRRLPELVRAAQAMGLGGISFLSADLGSPAFGERHSGDLERLRLSPDDVREFGAVIDRAERELAAEFASRFIAESPAKLRRLAQYYAAANGDGPFPAPSCNAPWVSAVIEADGTVRPCFFHAAIGNVRTTPMRSIVRDALPQFRSTLDVATDAACAKCVCSLKVGWRGQPWN